MKKKKSNNILEDFNKELIDPLKEVSMDITEIPIDQIFENDILKEIPVVKTIVAVGKIGSAINNRHFVKKLLLFIKEYHDKFTDQEYVEYKKKFDNDEKFKSKVLEHLIIIIDKFVENEKAIILANLFRSFIAGKIDWDRFLSLSTCLNSLHKDGFKILHDVSKFKRPFEIPSADREACDLLSILYASGLAFTLGTLDQVILVSKMGQDLYNYGISSLYNT